LTAAPIITTYPPLDAGALLRGVGWTLRAPRAVEEFLRSGTVDETLLFGENWQFPGLFEDGDSRRDGRSLLVHLGRGAVYLVAKALAETCRCNKHHSAAVPSYHCGSEIEALVHAGFEPHFYRVGPDLEIDADSYEEAASRSCIEYVISYFGLPPSVDGIWPPESRGGEHRRRPVVEDAAHALYSRYPDGTPIGAKGDAAIFSVRKSIGAIDGGGLWMRSEFEGSTPGRASRERRRLGRQARSLASQVLLSVAAGNSALAGKAGGLVSFFSKTERAAAEGDLESVIYGFDDGGSDRWELPKEAILQSADRAALLTYLVLAGQWPEAAAAARRANYNRLLFEYDLAEFVPPSLRELPPQTAPLFLPLRVSDRAAAVAKFFERGIRVIEIWPTPHRLSEADFERELTPLRQELVAIPVHHSLTSSALERIGEVAIDVLSGHRP
jgi:hypothetical protein